MTALRMVLEVLVPELDRLVLDLRRALPHVCFEVFSDSGGGGEWHCLGIGAYPEEDNSVAERS
jgi:hypothetical protein